MSRFANQTALITGGTGGLGESHVRTCHAEGANVVIGSTAASLGKATKLAAELGFFYRVRSHLPRSPPVR